MSFISDIETMVRVTPKEANCFITLENKILQEQHAIEVWFRKQFQETPAPFYSSVDLRNAGYKLAPVDTNLFPAGFNNLGLDQQALCIQAAQSAMEKIKEGCVKILIIPENHSRNQFYFESLGRLLQILLQAGYDARVGNVDENFTESTKITLKNGFEYVIAKVQRQDNKLMLDGFKPCVILLNNDLSSGVPEILQNLQQVILPSLELGWSKRKKSGHFTHYSVVANEFANLLKIDPWLIDPYFDKAGQIDFSSREPHAEMEEKVENIFAKIHEKYREYKIDREPFVVVKADAGTYGMGILMVHSAKELRELNRKERNRMQVSKGGQKIEQVIIQEGVFTEETIGQDPAVAEPVIYMIGQNVVGGFYRVHKDKSVNENLNAPGMHFEPLAFSCPCNIPDLVSKSECQANRFYTYGVVARLAALAAARELADTQVI